MHVVIFEGSRWNSFLPLALSKPTFMLPCGMGTLLDKQIQLLKPTRLSLWVRPEFVDYCKQYVLSTLKIPTTINEPLNDEPALLTNGRTLHFAQFEMSPAPSVVLETEDAVQFANVQNMSGLGPEDVFQRSGRWLKLLELPRTLSQGRYADRIWDLISWNEEALLADFVRYRGCTDPPVEGPWHLINTENICLAKGAKLSPGCVLDGSKGPIVLDVGSSIGANAVLQGPCYVGEYSQIHPQALIRPGTTIGAMCKIGGEVSNSIFSSFTNKAHEGFIGDSFIGSWVNLGAGTTTSNLKNTYGEVTMRIGETEYKTGRQMLGSIIGDHTKTAIGTLLTTGSYVGYSCLLAGSGFAPKFTPSFTFWTEKGAEKYDMAKAKEVATRALGRRDKDWTDADEAIMKYVAQNAPTVEK
jgi:UDP-N-acetylglucosamine diphosphorylase/glucosamine-1-phosphate N-acetyltransferase